MPTLVQEFDTRQFDQGVLRIRQGLDTIEKEALDAGFGLDKAFSGNTKGIKETTAATRSLGTETKGANLILGQMRQILPAIGTGLVAGKVVDYANAWNAVERSVSTVAPTLGSVAGITGDLADISADAGLAIEGTAETFQQFSIATKSLNLDTGDTIDLVDTLSRGLSIFATSTGAASAAQTQLAQAFASGRLQGDEFRSIAENFPPLITSIAEVLGVTREEVRELSSEGVITSRVLIEAFERLETQLDGLAGTVERTTGQAFAGLTVRVQEFIGKLDNATGVSTAFTAFLDDLASDINQLGDIIFPDLNRQIDASTNELERLGRAVVDAGGTLDGLESNTGRAAIATQAYNEQLFEHRELLAEAAKQAALTALATDDGTDALNDGAIGFDRFARRAVEAGNDVSDFNQAVEDLGAESRRAAVGLADAEAELQDFIDNDRSIGRIVEAQGEFTQEIFKTIDAIEAENKALERAEEIARETEAANLSLARSLVPVVQQIAAGRVEFERSARAQDQLVEAQLEARRSFEESQRLIAVAAQNSAEISREAFEGLSDTFSEIVGVSGATLTDFFENLRVVSGELGDDISNAFSDIANNIARSVGASVEEVDGFFGLVQEGLDLLGVNFESILGDKATSIIERFSRLSRNETELLGQAFQGLGEIASNVFGSVAGFFGGGEAVSQGGGGGAAAAGGGGGGLAGLVQGVSSLFGSATGSVSSFGESSIGTLTNVNASVGELNTALGQTGAVAQVSAGSLLATAQAAAGLAGAVAQIAGADPRQQAFAQGGAAAGSIVGSAFGPVGTVAGGIIGGLGGSLLASVGGGGGDGPDSSNAEQLRNIGRDVGERIKEGLSISLGGVINELIDLDIESVGQNPVTAVFEELAITVGTFREALVGADVQLETFLRNRGANASEFRTFSTEALEALAEASLTASDTIADTFDLSLLDVIASFNALPPGTADSFAQIGENAREIAELFAEQFGLGVDEVELALNQLVETAGVALASIDDAADFFSASLADRFNVNLDTVQALVATFPDDFITSFGSIATNADEIARRIAVSFGLSFEEARAVVLEFAENAGISLSGIGVSAEDLGNQLVNTLTLSTDQIAFLLLSTAQVGAEAFENIRVGADGSFSLLDERANTTFTNLATTAGASTEDIQALLGLLASNADISLTDILTSGIFSFDGLSAANQASTTAILQNFGATAEQISILLGGIGADGVSTFEELEAQGAIVTAAMLDFFGVAGDDIIEILGRVEESGSLSFSGLTASSRAELAEVLAEFGVTGDQIRFIFEDLAQGAASNFASITSRATEDADGIETAFGQALGFIISTFGELEGSAASDLFSVQATAAAVGAAIAGAFAGAANSANGSFAAIQAGAGAAIGAANRAAAAARAARPTGQPQELARGGLITGPVALGGASAGLAFRDGGILPGLTSIFGGGVIPTEQLGIAGEAGKEGIFPIAETSDGLGIRGILPESQGNTNVFNIDARGAGDDVIKELRAMVLEVQRTTPSVVVQTVTRMDQARLRV